jgi:hypothetical protein
MPVVLKSAISSIVVPLSNMTGFSDASLQRSFMYISSPYPMKALYTQVVRNTHQAL